MSTTEFEEGEYVEGWAWQLIIPYDAVDSGRVKPCRHAIYGEVDRNTSAEDKTTRRRFILIQGVVKCENENEGGCKATILCLACLDEARDKTRRIQCQGCLVLVDGASIGQKLCYDCSEEVGRRDGFSKYEKEFFIRSVSTTFEVKCFECGKPMKSTEEVPSGRQVCRECLDSGA